MDTQRNERAASDKYSKLVDFEEKFHIQGSDATSITSVLSSLCKNYVKNYNFKRSFLGHFPVIETFRTYKWKNYFIKDFISGIMSGVLMIPLGLAYASLSTLPNVVGLYMSFFASITYFVFGTSRQLSWGCVATASLMMASVMDKYDHSQDAISFISSLNHSDITSIKEPDLDFKVPSTVSTLNAVKDHDEVGDVVSGVLTNATNRKLIMNAISARRIEVASGIAVITGSVLVLESIIGFSRFTSIMSDSLIDGFNVGIAINVVTSQLNGLFGFSIKKYIGNFWVPLTWIDLFGNLQETNLAVLGISFICILVMYLVKKFANEKYKHRIKIPISIEMLVVIAAILVTKYNNLNERFGVGVLGIVPTGVPSPKFPNILLVLKYEYIVDATVIALVVHVQSLALAKTISLGGSRGIRYGQEMLAAGICSVVCGIFSGYIPGAYLPISVVQRDSGGVTQLASLFAAGIVILVIMLVGPYLYNLPNCVISAIVLINLRPLLMRIFAIQGRWKMSRFDCIIWSFTCIATLVLELGNALVLSVGFSIFLILLRSMVSPIVEIVPIQRDQKSALLMRPTKQYLSVKTLLTVKLIRIKTGLYFFNSDSFVDAVFQTTNVNRTQTILVGPTRSKKSRRNEMLLSDTESLSASEKNEITPLISTSRKISSSLIKWKTLIIDVSQVSFMDVMGVEALEFVVEEFQSIGIRVLITSVPDNVFGILRSTGFWNKYRERLFIDVQSALDCVSTISDSSTLINRNGGRGDNNWV